jgi:hypothetical protein
VTDPRNAGPSSADIGRSCQPAASEGAGVGVIARDGASREAFALSVGRADA